MGHGRKTFLLDSTVLLYDVDVIQHFKRSNVVIPSFVIDDLDKHVGQKTDFGIIARDQLHYLSDISKMGDINQGVIIDDEILVRIDTSIGSIDKKRLPHLGDLPQNRIVHLAHGMREVLDNIVVVSRSVAVRLSLEVLGIEAVDFQPPRKEIDPVSRMRTIHVDKSVIDHSYIDGHVLLADENFFNNEYVLLLAKENSQLLCRYHPREQKLIPIRRRGTKVARGILPKNLEQEIALDMLLSEDIPLVSLIGRAGTGKTLLAMAAAFEMVFDKGIYKHLIVTRPVHSLGPDIGHLPGTAQDKLKPLFGAYFDNIETIKEARNEDVGDVAEWVSCQPKIKMEAIAHMRGRSFQRSILIIDECQNCSPHEIKTLISRSGIGTKVILIGDIEQIDAKNLNRYSNGLSEVTSHFANSPIAAYSYLQAVERSALALEASRM
ncbi:MAG: PhoH family protein [Verrucomicrobia bacterium]|nr:PhoH family protein [Verrucomicrobiota bacterium]